MNGGKVSSANTATGKALAEVRERVAAAAGRSGRKVEEVSLLAVTKTVGVDRVREAVEAGQLLFGENRVQEAAKKIPVFPEPCSWHMIGHLQKNKVKAAVELFDAVESVDSEELAELISRRAVSAGKVMKVFVQVKEGLEETKTGISPEGAPSLFRVGEPSQHVSDESLGFSSIRTRFAPVVDAFRDRTKRYAEVWPSKELWMSRLSTAGWQSAMASAASEENEPRRTLRRSAAWRSLSASICQE
jgi:hypothetical protein